MPYFIDLAVSEGYEGDIPVEITPMQNKNLKNHYMLTQKEKKKNAADKD